MKAQPTGPFPYSPIHKRRKLTWPNNARVALWVIPNIEHFALNEALPPTTGTAAGKIPDVFSYSMRDYGNRVGIWRLIDVMSRHNIRGTVALNSDICDYCPDIIEETVKLDWEFMGHNESNTRRLNQNPETEHDIIKKTLDRIEKATGKRPKGWLGSGLQETWNTLDYLIEEGCTYVADWVNDDQPYRMNVDGKQIVSIPYSGEINDKVLFDSFSFSSAEFEKVVRDQFDVLYEEGAQSGRVMAIALHPYIIGVPHRIRALDAALKYICAHEGVWLATGEEIINSYLSQTQGD